MRLPPAVMVILVTASCTTTAPPSDTKATKAEGIAADVREPARAVLDTYCGRCHDPNGETPKPEAMAVFDLTDEIFEHRMTDEHFANMIGRLSTFEVPEDERGPVVRFVRAAGH